MEQVEKGSNRKKGGNITQGIRKLLPNSNIAGSKKTCVL
jgi:hypothetical protein